MPRIKRSRFRNLFKYFEHEEREKEDHNVKAVDHEIDKLVHTQDKPIKQFVKKESKASKRKPIDTHVLLKGFK